ncbi:Ubiquitin carboxyl-terminal hydrolase isozyme L3 [Golovinomyces cichoracearum]|uniref:Ubiquitin carboxyl-terminal hydrolase n=1 Tax=Golovinomyces cichoracearum TaxID=62708 RepID=A0A420IR84_9PEZI|nr:Ubiquitin carboxyl-terminal hydrolase isozyme L3 [Golovinomyces cichoracearum]
MTSDENALTTHGTNPSVTNDTKRWKALPPLENNPDVMTALVHRLGLSTEMSFHDVFSIDDPDLLSFIPRPVAALVLVFPINEAYVKFRQKEDQDKLEYNEKGSKEPVIWFKQTIRNSCGLMAILHAACNGSARNFIKSGSILEKLVNEAVPLDPIKRAELIYNSKDLEAVHLDSASKGQSHVLSAEDDVDLHFVCFVKDQDHNLWEMDGQRKGPLLRGKLNAEEDVLSERALELSVRRFLNREHEPEKGEMRFSLLALSPKFDN